MNCAKRNCVYALIGTMLMFLGFSATAKDNAKAGEAPSIEKFQWHEHALLSWDDFKGEVRAEHDESAAATCCSIGFKTTAATPGSKQQVVVYNTFYTNKSWVRPDARIQSILDHEQGHFDLCEVYTRKLKSRVSNFDLTIPGAKDELMRIYAEVSKDYEARQQAYEQETVHGTDLANQRKWQDAIASELQF